MIGFCLDEGDKIFIEIGIENKKKCKWKMCLK